MRARGGRSLSWWRSSPPALAGPPPLEPTQLNSTGVRGPSRATNKRVVIVALAPNHSSCLINSNWAALEWRPVSACRQLHQEIDFLPRSSCRVKGAAAELSITFRAAPRARGRVASSCQLSADLECEYLQQLQFARPGAGKWPTRPLTAAPRVGSKQLLEANKSPAVQVCKYVSFERAHFAPAHSIEFLRPSGFGFSISRLLPRRPDARPAGAAKERHAHDLGAQAASAS